jgi:uncharacterized protein YprB with RNaseH-like and TPR domain
MRKKRHLQSQGKKKLSERALEKLRVGYLDIEASNLNADFGIMLSWYIKTRGKNEYKYAVITKKELFSYQFDKRIVKELLEAIREYDVLYVHWGKDRRYDIPFIRTRALVNHHEDLLPEYMEKFIMDTWDTARAKLKLSRNSLQRIAETLGVKNVLKTPVTGEQWVRAMYGDPKALEYVRIHNKHDVQILERVHKRLQKVEKKTYMSM